MKKTQTIDPRLLDKEWRIDHLYKIVDKDGNVSQFKRNRMQRDFDANKHTFNIILKSRQLGQTTYEAIDMLDDALFNKNFPGLFIAHTKDDAIKIFDNKIKFAWDNFPLQNLYSVDSNRANELKVDFGEDKTGQRTFSYIIVANSGRSGTYRRVHISEFAKICKKYPENAKEIITGTLPTVPIGGRVDIEGTAEGEAGDFYDMFWEAWNRGEPETPKQFKAHFYNWQWDDREIAKITPENIESFKKNEDFVTFDEYRKKMFDLHGITITDQELTFYYFNWLTFNRRWDKLRQEFPTTPEEAFIGSGNKLFDQDKIALLKTKEGKKDGDWTIYEDFNYRGVYAIGADVAEGVGQDSSTAVVMNFTNGAEVVAEFSSNRIAPDQFAYELAKFGRKYGNCLIAPERNSIGHTTVSKLKEIYANVYREEDIKKGFETKSRFIRPLKTFRYGWLTSLVSKPLMLYELSEALMNGEIVVNSKTIVHELRTYDREDLSQIRFDSEQTRHWDLLMALAICFQLRTKITRGKSQAWSFPKEKF